MNPVQDAFQDFATRVGEQVPEFQHIFSRAKAGEISEMEAMGEMARLLQEHPEVGSLIHDLAQNSLAPLRENLNLDEIGDEAFFTGVGLPKINPLMEAHIVERAQFDGDIPEWRHGPMVPGAKPAVSVVTDARDPVAIGRMLSVASDKMALDIETHETKRLQGIEAEIQAVGESTDSSALILAGQKALMQILGSAETDLPTYRRGEVPAPLTVPAPEASVLAALTLQERKEAAYKFLSTTQGRRTAVAVIRELIASNLRAGGIEVTEREYDPGAAGDIVAHHEWSIAMSGPGATQPSFALVDTAAKALYKGLVRNLTGKPTYLEVVAVNTVDVRTVGWAARLVR